MYKWGRNRRHHFFVIFLLPWPETNTFMYTKVEEIISPRQVITGVKQLVLFNMQANFTIHTIFIPKQHLYILIWLPDQGSGPRNINHWHPARSCDILHWKKCKRSRTVLNSLNNNSQNCSRECLRIPKSSIALGLEQYSFNIWHKITWNSLEVASI